MITLAPFGKKVYAEPITMASITLILSILSACGVTVNFLMSDVFPKSGGFDPGVLDNPLTTAEDRKAMMAEFDALNVPNSNFAKQALDAVGAKLKPFTDKVGELASRFSLSGMAAIIGMGVAELIAKAKTGTLELSAEQTIAMQKFMSENFGEVMVGNLSVMDGTTATFADMCSVPHSFPLTIGEENRTNYYTNTRTKEYFYMTFPRNSDGLTFQYYGFFYRLLGTNLFNRVCYVAGSLATFPTNSSSLVYTFTMNSGLNRLTIRPYSLALPNGALHNASYFFVSSNPIDWQSTDSIIVSTDAPTLAATGSLQFPTTDLPLTLPNTLTGGVSIPVSQDMAEYNTKTLADAIARAGGIDVPGEIPPIPPIIPPDTPDFMMPGNIINKFPFSIPFDIVKGARLLVAPPITPKFDVSFSIPARGKDIPINFTIDLTPFDKVAAMCRTFAVLIFTVGLAVATPRIVKGAR